MQRHFSPGKTRFRTAPKRNQTARRGAPKPIDFRRFINKASKPADEAPYELIHQTFSDFKLNDKLVANLSYLRFTVPSPIQDQCIEESLLGHDLIGLANTGTGKTAAFLLPIIHKLLAEPDRVSVVILAPTRELAEQINNKFKRFANGQKLYSSLLVGGTNINQQIRDIKRGPHVIIGTPGRIIDLLNRKVLRLGSATTFVLDEADRMCDMGFIKDIERIESELKPSHQTLCYSATMTDSVKRIVEKFMKNPKTISVVKNETNNHIEQDVIRVTSREEKFEKLEDLLVRPEFARVIVFGDTKFGVQRLADRLAKSDIKAIAIHGNKSQSQRTRALNDFKNGKYSVLVATDVAARGIDVRDVSHVINFDQPKTYSDYIHRIGRTGRAGKLGHALTFVA